MRNLGFIFILVACLALPSVAHASGGETDSGATLTVVLFLLMIAAAYLLVNFVINKLQSRFLIVAGFEYVLLGVLLGPLVPQIHVLEDLTGLLPVIALSAGWIGLLRGTGFDVDFIRNETPGTARIVLLHSVLPGLLVGLGSFYILASGWLGNFSQRDAALTAAVLGCCAGTDSTEPFEILDQRYNIEGKLSHILRNATKVGDVVTILVFGTFAFCVYHQGSPGSADLRPTEWAAVQIGLGILLGLLFTPFLGGDESDNGHFLALVGIISFASGAAYYLNLSSLVVNLVLGIVLAIISSSAKKIHAALERTEQPMKLVLMVFAGALWVPPNLDPMIRALRVDHLATNSMRWWILRITLFLTILFAYSIARVIGKWCASRISAFGTEQRSDVYRGLLAQGEVAIAMAVSFQLVYDNPLLDLAYTVILASILLHDLAAPRWLRRLLVDAGELRRERTAAETAPVEAS